MGVKGIRNASGEIVKTCGSRVALLEPRLVIRRVVRPGGRWRSGLLVERLIANLLENAVRDNVPGGRVEISTRVEGDKAIVSIANTGPVIPPEQVHRLFDPFQRLDRTRVDDHHGLGLSILRALAITHDATLIRAMMARAASGRSVLLMFSPRVRWLR